MFNLWILCAGLTIYVMYLEWRLEKKDRQLERQILDLRYKIYGEKK